jgi:hypothetical protein
MFESVAIRGFNVDQDEPDPLVVVDSPLAKNLGPQLIGSIRFDHTLSVRVTCDRRTPSAD